MNGGILQIPCVVHHAVPAVDSLVCQRTTHANRAVPPLGHPHTPNPQALGAVDRRRDRLQVKLPVGPLNRQIKLAHRLGDGVTFLGPAGHVDHALGA